MTLKPVKKKKNRQEPKTEVDKNIVNSYHVVVKGILKGCWNRDNFENYI